MKKVILGFIIGIVVCGVVGVSAYTLLAKDIAYKDTNVEAALNDLYTTTNQTISNLQAELVSHNTLTLQVRTTISGQSATSGTTYITSDLKDRYQYFKLNILGTPSNIGSYKFRGAHKTNGNSDMNADTQYNTSDYNRIWLSLTPNSSASTSSPADAIYTLYFYN